MTDSSLNRALIAPASPDQKTTKPLTVAEVILKQLALWDVKHIYGVAGDAILAFLAALPYQNQIRYIDVRHETAAALMASTEGKCTQHIGVCIATSGPGLVNMLNGIADAAQDRIPLLVISGQVERKKAGTEAKQYINQQQMMAPLAVYSTELEHPEAIVDVLQKALIEAQSQRGVAHLSVPKDLFSAVCQSEPRAPLGLLHQTKPQNLSALDQAVTRLAEAQKPVILIGEGSRGAAHEIKQLAAILQAGIIETLGAKGVIPYQHPLNLGGIGQGGIDESKQTLQQSDCILAIGANWWPEGFVPQQTEIIQIDQSPAAIEGHRHVKYALVGDAVQVTGMLLQRLRERQQVQNSNRKTWEKQIVQTKKNMNRRLEFERSQATSDHHPSAISPQRLMSVIDEHVNPDAIIVLDTGDHTLWFNRHFRAERQDVLYSGKWRTMGYGLPAALAAKLAYPEKQVVAIVGDGGLAMTMMEFSTAVKHRLPVIVIVVNNRSLALEKHKMMAEGYAPFGVDLHNPDFARLAETFGAKGVRVEKEDELAEALSENLFTEQPVCFDVQTTASMIPSMSS